VLDTVASVGIAHVAPFFAGHMDWADDSQLLPEAKTYPGFVKCCRHFVASFEQRACIPLDSIGNEDGQYPANAWEVVYLMPFDKARCSLSARRLIQISNRMEKLSLGQLFHAI